MLHNIYKLVAIFDFHLFGVEQSCVLWVYQSWEQLPAAARNAVDEGGGDEPKQQSCGL